MSTQSNQKQQSKIPQVDKKNNLSEFLACVQMCRKDIIAYTIGTICWFILLHFCYPFADMNTDTGGYIHWAYENKYGSTRPLGYTWFLKAIHDFSVDTLAVFFVQLVIYYVTSLLFYISVVYLFDIKNQKLRYWFVISQLLFVSAFYISNVILTDSLFLSFTILMLTACLWFLRKQHLLFYVIALGAMMFCINIRYIGLLYPAIIILTAILGLKKKLITIAAVLVPCVVVYAYVQHIAEQTDADQGIRMFSGFGGWQKANNALHIVPHVKLDEPLVHTDDNDILLVDSIVRQGYPVVEKKYPGNDEVSYQFLWNDTLPLRVALFVKGHGMGWGYYYSWLYMGRVFSDYGDLMIKEHPVEFVRYFLWNNFKGSLLPEAENFRKFLYTNKTGEYERHWFELDRKLNGKKEIEPAHDVLRPVLKSLPYQYTLLWIALICVVVVFISMVRKRHMAPLIMNIILLMLAYIVIYILGNIYASPVNVRYFIPVRALVVPLVIICIDLRNKCKLAEASQS